MARHLGLLKPDGRCSPHPWLARSENQPLQVSTGGGPTDALRTKLASRGASTDSESAMPIFFPTFGSCSWDTTGERRFAERLRENLEDDYLCWYNVPIGRKHQHPDFVILNPRRGILILEVKD